LSHGNFNFEQATLQTVKSVQFSDDMCLKLFLPPTKIALSITLFWKSARYKIAESEMECMLVVCGTGFFACCMSFLPPNQHHQSTEREK